VEANGVIKTVILQKLKHDYIVSSISDILASIMVNIDEFYFIGVFGNFSNSGINTLAPNISLRCGSYVINP
jgi:hypothetical protein